jgi:hypothetical protein
LTEEEYNLRKNEIIDAMLVWLWVRDVVEAGLTGVGGKGWRRWTCPCKRGTEMVSSRERGRATSAKSHEERSGTATATATATAAETAGKGSGR